VRQSRVDVRLSEARDITAAWTFFRSAKTVTGITPTRVTKDGHDSYPRVIQTELGEDVGPTAISTTGLSWRALRRERPLQTQSLGPQHRFQKMKIYSLDSLTRRVPTSVGEGFRLGRPLCVPVLHS
jgi:transposase-like protein